MGLFAVFIRRKVKTDSKHRLRRRVGFFSGKEKKLIGVFQTTIFYFLKPWNSDKNFTRHFRFLICPLFETRLLESQTISFDFNNYLIVEKFITICLKIKSFAFIFKRICYKASIKKMFRNIWWTVSPSAKWQMSTKLFNNYYAQKIINLISFVFISIRFKIKI